MRATTLKTLLPYSVVVVLAYIAFSLPLPLLPEMFLDPQHGILPHSYSIGTKTMLLGMVMASFPLGQFFGSPLLGHLSDRYGRKKVILVSLFGAILGYVITALGVMSHSVPGMFVGLMVCGFSEGNVTIAQSVIADISAKEEKAIHFGWINVFIALGFIIGPLMGGQLADPTVAPWFSYSTPFWMGAILTGAGMGVVVVASKETLRVRARGEWKLMTAVMSGLKRRGLRRFYLANFFLALGYFAYFRFLPVFLERAFDFSPAELGYVMVYNSIAIAVGVVCLIGPLSRRLSPQRQLALFSLLLAGSFLLCLAPDQTVWLWATIPLVGICLAVTITNGSLVISNGAPDDFQGQALGSLTSVQVLAEFVTGIGGGVLASQMMTLPLYVGAAMTFLCGILLWRRE